MILRQIRLKKKKLLDIFVISNFFFLALDIFYAHSINDFAHKGEWIPFYFSIIATILLGINLVLKKEFKNIVSFTLGLLSIIIGTLGVFYHLESQFFQSVSLKSLVYTAPLAAPLSYTALGLLLFLNNLIPSQKAIYGQWIVVLAYIGFAGNFLLGLLDHAQNGFFFISEWIPVISAALILVFIPLGLIRKYYKLFMPTFKYLLWLQFFVGILGAFLHIYAILIDNSASIIDKLLYGPPVLAPLLFCNLAFLMAVGLMCIKDEHKKYIEISPKS